MDGSNPFHEQRRYPRRKLETAVVVLNGVKYQFEKTAEISEGGMLVRIRKPAANGEKVEVQFILPSRRFVSAQGEIVYGLKNGDQQHYVGIRFLKLPPQAQTWIRDFVDHKV